MTGNTITALHHRTTPNSQPDSETQRYTRDIRRLQDDLRWGRIYDELAGVSNAYRVRRHGVVTVAAQTKDIPHRYLLGLAGFRLAQYLRLGYASSDVTFRKALFCEPITVLNPTDWHALALDEASGEILGYLELAGNGDVIPHPVHEASTRNPFPVEEAHRIDLFQAVAARHDLTTHTVWEAKRFVHSGNLKRKDLRLRVSLELLLAMGRIVESAYPAVLSVIGDAEADAALRHIVLLGLNVTVVTGTVPQLPEDDLTHPSYITRDVVEPFYAEVPDLAEVSRRTAIIDSVIDQPDIFADIHLLMTEMPGTVDRIDHQPMAAAA
jgi:hypothetical protein